MSKKVSNKTIHIARNAISTVKEQDKWLRRILGFQTTIHMNLLTFIALDRKERETKR